MPNSRRRSWKIKALAATALAGASLAQASLALADDTPKLVQVLGLSGTLRGTVSSHDFSFGRGTAVAAASAWFTAEPARFLGIKAFVDGRIETEQRPHSSRTTWELREAYAERSFGAVDLKAGRQIIVWGRADKVNPTDVWSARDLTLAATDDEDQRLGAAAVQATWHVGQLSLAGLWQPEWRTPRFPIPPLPDGLVARVADPTDAASQFGLKIDHSGDGADWSLAYARAIDKTPDLRFNAPGRLDVLFQPLEMYGADAAVPIGQYGLRGEIAYRRRLRRGADIAAKYDDLFLVTGIERTFGGELNINVQYLYRRNYGFRDPGALADPSIRALTQQEDVLAGQVARDMNGFSTRISDRFLNETLVAEISGVAWLGRAGGTVGPKLSYALNDQLQLIAGGRLYFGPKTGVFGSFRGASAVYMEVRRGF